MKRFIALLLLVLMLTGCAFAPAPETVPTGTTAVANPPEQLTKPATDPTVETPPVHSELYIEGLSCDAVITYFGEVCLDAEIVNSGDPRRLQKWDAPILYQILGDPTPEDLATLAAFADWLNSLPGFPGILEAESEASAMDIHFCSQEEMASILGDWTLSCDGGVTFWYENDCIRSATVCVRTDLDQQLRNSVILEELYNSLGPIQDTSLREDSVIWSGYSQPQRLTEEDKLLLKLLYHPDMEPGMDPESCARVIRELYY